MVVIESSLNDQTFEGGIMVNSKNKSLLPVSLDYDGQSIRLADSDNMFSLTDAWKAAGSDSSQKPVVWLRNSATVGLIGELEKVIQDHLLVRTVVGRNGGTWAHFKLALAYAAYLNPKFHAWMLHVVQERFEEMQNPELGLERSRERAIKTWEKQGKSQSWIDARLRGIHLRNALSTFISSRCQNEKNPHGVITNSMYVGAFGNTAAGLREERGLTPKANMREALEEHELLLVMAAESATMRKAEADRVWGRDQLAQIANKSGKAMSDAFQSIMDMKL